MTVAFSFSPAQTTSCILKSQYIVGRRMMHVTPNKFACKNPAVEYLKLEGKTEAE